MENYKEKYEQAMLRMNKWVEGSEIIEPKEVAEFVFPELKESEDEKIRKEIIYYLDRELTLSNFGGDIATFKKWIAWLEKQGEQKFPSLSEKEIVCLKRTLDFLREEHNSYTGKDFTNEIAVLEWLITHPVLIHPSELQQNQGEQKPTDKVEPKFRNGEWIVWQDKCYKVNYNGCGYELVDQNGLSKSLEYETIDENAHLWDIAKDAKDGDVLVTENKNIFIFKSISDYTVYDYCGLYVGKFFEFSSAVNGIRATQPPTDYVPATKEQRELLLEKIVDAGYIWDTEKKELKKIEQKPAWSEEDEKLYTWCASAIQTRYNDGLFTIDEYRETSLWLKSLKERYTWKPSDEQMKQLGWIAEQNKDNMIGKELMSLYQDLKKLREE